ncbi:hypothetical protein HAX54_029722, partial [Datura stramonium]|nr:hypothetical protein [Datura stramonium]
CIPWLVPSKTAYKSTCKVDYKEAPTTTRRRAGPPPGGERKLTPGPEPVALVRNQKYRVSPLKGWIMKLPFQRLVEGNSQISKMIRGSVAMAVMLLQEAARLTLLGSLKIPNLSRNPRQKGSLLCPMIFNLLGGFVEKGLRNFLLRL